MSAYNIDTQKFLTYTNRGLELLWLMAVVLVPLAFITRGDLISASAIAYLEVPKIALLRTLVGLMAVLWLVEWGIQGRLSLPSFLMGQNVLSRRGEWLASLRSWLTSQPERWLFAAVGLFLAVTLISTGLSTSFGVSMWGEVPGEDGYAAYTVIAYVVLFGVIATHLRTSAQLWRLLGAIAVMGMLVAGYAIFQHYGHDFLDLKFPTNISRATSTMGNPILAGAVLLMTIPISLIVAVSALIQPLKTNGFWWKLILWGVVIAVQLLGLSFTFGRGPWIGAIVAVVGFIGLMVVFRHWRELIRVAAVLGLAVVLALVTLLVPGSLGRDDGAAPISGSVAELFTSAGSQISVPGGEFGASGLSGRIEIWKESGRLMTSRPWFDFDSLSLPFLRPVFGYGPELFRYTFMIVSPPRGPDLIPRESVHAHNYFIHQGVELGYLGILSSLGIYVVPFLAGLYLLVRGGRGYSLAHRLVLVGLLAILAGRFLEQLVGLARVSDLTVFWVLLAVFAALPRTMKTAQPVAESPANLSAKPPQPPVGPAAGRHRLAWQGSLRLLVVACLIAGVGTLTWLKTVSYYQAGVMAAEAAEQSQDGDLQGAISSFDRAIDLAPDVWINYNRRAAVYSSYIDNQEVPKETGCSHGNNRQPYLNCLTEQAYLANLAAVEQRQYNFRAHHALALSALELATLNREEATANATVASFEEATDLVPAAWPLYNQLAFSYFRLGLPAAALEPLEKSLNITGANKNSAKAHRIRGVVYRQLGQPQRAIENFDQAIQLVGYDFETYNNRAMAFLILGQAQKALEDFDEIIRCATSPSCFDPDRGPGYAEAYSNRGLLYRGLGQTKLALEDFDQAITLDPGYAIAYNNRGLAHSDRGNLQLALADYNEALRLDPTSVRGYVNRGLLYAELGQLELAVLESEEAIRLNSEDGGAYALRAVARYLLGNETAAEQDIDRAVDLGIDRAVVEEIIEELRK